MRSVTFLLIACGFTFLCAFKDAQGLVEPNSGKMSSSFHRIKRARMDGHWDAIIPRDAKPLTKCEQLRQKALHGPVGTYVPQCKEDGSFEPKQCSGSTGYCWCVDENGNEIPGTQTPPGNPDPQCNGKPLAKCEQLREKALHGPVGTYVPQCKEDGSFEPKQCSGSTGYCWCVDENGNEIPGTQTPPGNPDLQCNEQAQTKCEKLRAEALKKLEEGDILVLVPKCRADGSFNPVQCDQRFSLHFANCWCVDENGEKINGTEVTVGFGQYKLPDCGDIKTDA